MLDKEDINYRVQPHEERTGLAEEPHKLIKNDIACYNIADVIVGFEVRTSNNGDRLNVADDCKTQVVYHADHVDFYQYPQICNVFLKLVEVLLRVVVVFSLVHRLPGCDVVKLYYEAQQDDHTHKVAHGGDYPDGTSARYLNVVRILCTELHF